MKRRIITMLLVVAMAISLFPSTAFKANAASTSQPIISVEEVWAAAGNTVEVNVKILDNPGILGATLTLSWAENLILVDAESGEAFDGLNYQEPSYYVNSGTNFVWYGTRLKNIQDGTVLKLTFRVAESATEGDLLAINVSGSGITDTDKNPVTALFVGGTLQVLSYTPGDVDDNGEIDPLDLIILAKYISDGCKTDPNGYNVSPNTNASDVNDDGEYTPLDLILISQYISDGCETDPNGYNVVLKPRSPKCNHTMQMTAFKAATCTEDGNVSYYHCTTCDKYYNDSVGTKELTLANTILAATGHNVVIDPAVPPTYDAPGLTEGSHCDKCDMVFIKQEVLDPIEGFAISYNLTGTDTYLAQQQIQNNKKNPVEYNPEQGSITLYPLDEPDGYEFLGWYDAPQTVGGNRVTEIKKGSTGDITLYAHWEENKYDITYKLYQTPLGAITEEKYLTYTVSKGLSDLPNPEINNYIFLGWYTNDGEEVEEIPVGTTGDITLNAYWTSKRNLTKAVKSLDDPIIIEDSTEGIIYFTYELGTIENVPLSDALWTIQSVAGLAQQKSETYTTSISQEQASAIAKTISSTTVDSATWTLSKNWNDVTEVNEEWAEQNGMTQEEANTKSKTESGSYSVTDSKGGCKTKTETDGTTTVDYNSQNYTHGNSAEFNAKINANYTTEVGGNVGLAKAHAKFEVGGEIGGGYEQHKETDEHTGTDTTTVDTTVKTGTSSWNKASTKTETQQASESVSVRNALSTIISNTKGYGKSYAEGGQNSQARDFSTTDSQSANTSSTLTYFNSETKTTTTTYSTDGKSEGCYRMVVAGTIHVFGVVGYDVATQSYFTYTFNVLDDKTYEFLDYSPDLNFNDYENGVIPFEIPYFVYEYVASKTVCTEGLTFRTNSSNGTATVTGFNNQNLKDVVIPSYITSGGTAYKVTGMSSNAFAGKPIEAIVLSDYINEIPAGTFKNCTSLKQVSGSFTKIGDEAFSGCTAMESFTVSTRTTELGENAFEGVSTLKVKVLNADAAMSKAKLDNPTATEAQLTQYAKNYTQALIDAAIASGADEVILDISNVIGRDGYTFEVGAISTFELLGGGKTYTDLRIHSSADTTILRELTIKECKRIPLEISSENLVLEVVNVESQGYALLLSADTPTITLMRDNNMTAAYREAVVFKAPELDSRITGMAVGTLAVTGNVYVNGTTEAINQMKQSDYLTVEEGQVITLSNDEFAKYIKGAFNVNFNANGGQCSENSKTVFCGSAVGALPTPTRTGYEFLGWYRDNGAQVTSSTVLDVVGDVTLYAKWSALAYTANWNTGTGYTVAVNRTASPYAGASTGKLSSGTMVYYGDVLSVTYTANTGYTLTGSGKTSVTVSGNVSASDIYASAKVNSYNVNWNTGTGYAITVKRTSSPLAGAAVETLSSGSVIYYGDVLSVTYTANTGYSLTGKGSTSVTVKGNVTASDIYASASPNKYTYNIVYKSSNGTNLGSATAGYLFGTTNTITPPNFSGYSTPSAQTVKWDSTSAKTITFTYVPSSVSNSAKTGNFSSSSPKITYSTTIQYRNRTATSVQVQVTTTVKMQSGWSGYKYGVAFDASCGSVGTGKVQVAALNGLSSSGSSCTASSGWITIPLNTTNATTISLNVNMYNTNWQNNYVNSSGYHYNSYTWTVNIPAY